MSSFKVSKEDVKNFCVKPTLNGMSGIFYLYAAEEKVIKEIIPAPLTFCAPVVVGYFVGFSHTTFGGPYTEFCIGVPALYQGQVGVYPLSLMLAGHGAEGAVKVGTNYVGFPKKIADSMELSRNGNEVIGKIIRHGVTIFECKCDIDGAYNQDAAKDFLGLPSAGETVPGGYYVHHLNYIQTETGECKWLNVDLCQLFTQHTVKSYVPGKLKELHVASSADDAYGELPIIEPMGCAYFETDGITMAGTKILEACNPEETLPYLMTQRFDRGLMGDETRYFRNINAKA